MRAVVDEIVYRRDVGSGTTSPAKELQLNDLGRIKIRLAGPLCVAPYSRSRALGSVLLIDESTGETVGAAMVR